MGVVSTGGGPRLVEVRDGEVRDLGFDGDVTALVARGLDPAELTAGAAAPLGERSLIRPLRPGKIIAVGMNYREHVREFGAEIPTAPIVFAILPSAVIGPGEAIVIDRAVTERVDWEVELAIVIGRRMRHVDQADALDHVFGYTVANDVSARDVQRTDGQWMRAKSLDTFCPLGPVVATPETVGDPQRLGLRTRVNGATVQESSTADMIFGVAELLAFCSASFTLEPGDVVLTGTPWGCGEFMTPPRSLAAGDDRRDRDRPHRRPAQRGRVGVAGRAARARGGEAAPSQTLDRTGNL